MLQMVTGDAVARQIDGTLYFIATEVANAVGITRQTLWRWRTEGRIPAGRRYRGHQVMFTEPEVKAIQRFAHRLEPDPLKSTPSPHNEPTSALPRTQENR